MYTKRQFRTYIEKYILLQTMLLVSFKEYFPLLKDWENLLDFPKYGDLRTPKGSWKFYVHGCGLTFMDTEGVTVDAHDMILTVRF